MVFEQNSGPGRASNRGLGRPSCNPFCFCSRAGPRAARSSS